MSSERTRTRGLVLLAFAGLSALGCADFSRGAPPISEPDAAAPDGGADVIAGGDATGLSFAADVHGLLVDGCQRCHAAGGQAGDTDFVLSGDATADRAATVEFVDLDQPAASRLLSKGSGTGHGGGAVYAVGTPEYQTILEWISQGAMP